MNTSPATPVKEEKTRWSVLIGALVVTGIIAYFAIRYYQLSGPYEKYLDGLVAIDTQNWTDLQESITFFEGLDEYRPHQACLQSALALRDGKIEEAEGLLELAKEDKAVRPRALFMLAYLAVLEQRIDDADGMLAEALELDPKLEQAKSLRAELAKAKDPENRVDRAIAAISAGDEKTLQRELKLLIDNPETVPYAKFVTGVFQMSLERYNDALIAFDGSRTHPKLRKRTLTFSGECLYRLKQYSDSERLWIETIKEFPDAVDAHRFLAVWYYDQGANDYAAFHLAKVSELDKEDPRPERLLGRMSLDFEKFEDAIAHFDEAIKRNPRAQLGVEIFLEKARALCRLKRSEEAIKCLDEKVFEVLDIGPLKAERDALYAEAYNNLGDLEKAAKYVDLSLSRNPDFLDALVLQGSILLIQEKNAEALAVLEKAVRIDPYDYQAAFKLSQAIAASGDAEKAKLATEKANELKTLRETFSKLHEDAAKNLDDPKVRVELGRVAEKLGRLDLAAVWYQAVLKIDPLNADAKTLLEAVLQKLSAPASPLNPELQQKLQDPFGAVLPKQTPNPNSAKSEPAEKVGNESPKTEEASKDSPDKSGGADKGTEK